MTTLNSDIIDKSGEVSKTLPNTIFNSFDINCGIYSEKTLFSMMGNRSITYSQANTKVRKFASALIELGVQKGDRIAAQVDKSPEAILVYLACLQVGGVYLPLNTAYTASEIGYFLGDAEPRVFICPSDSVNEDYPGIPQDVAIIGLDANGSGDLSNLAQSLPPLQTNVEMAKDDLAAILYTSGTTGRSKGAMLTHQNLSSNCDALLKTWEFTDQDHLIHALPIFHTHGLFVACNMVLASGASMEFLTGFDIEEIIILCSKSSVLMGVPTFYTRMLASKSLTQEAVKGMRLFVSGSAPLLADTHTEFQARTGHTILERYGMTETCMNTSNPYNGERRPGTVGLPLPDIEVRVVDQKSATPLKAGDTGSIEVRGPNVFKGYWKMPEKTAEDFRKDGFFITGDLGTVDDRGYLKIVGRDKDLVISGGYNIYPKELELLIDEVPGVLESAVIGVPMPDLGEAVTAIVVLQKDAQLEPEQILEKIAPHLARYKQPRKIFMTEELPRNVMGKVMKNKLRETYADIYQQKD